MSLYQRKIPHTFGLGYVYRRVLLSVRSGPPMCPVVSSSSPTASSNIKKSGLICRACLNILLLWKLLCLLFKTRSCVILICNLECPLYHFLPGCGRTRESPFSLRFRNFSWRLLVVTLSGVSLVDDCGIERPRTIGDITEDQSL
jgi:hypothetical protein